MDGRFTIRRGTDGDVDRIFRAMSEVKAGMEHPEWYVTDDREYIAAHVADKGFIMIAETEAGELAAYLVVDYPDGEENMGRELHFNEAQLARVAHMDSSAVLPAYRGNRLQERLGGAAERKMRAEGKKEYLFSTIHPDNRYSLGTALRRGFVIVATGEKYGGLRRHTLYKHIDPAPVRPNILVSACLLGTLCRYNGLGVLDEAVRELMGEANLIPVCPEITGGLSTPRVPAERVGNRVITRTGGDVTEQYRRGAEETLKLARLYGCRLAVLKERSPSCGSGTIYDGTHTGKLTGGDGVTAELLKASGIAVFGESEIRKIKDFMDDMKNL